MTNYSFKFCQQGDIFTFNYSDLTYSQVEVKIEITNLYVLLGIVNGKVTPFYSN